MVASRRVTRLSTANLGGGLRMTLTAPTGAGPDELDISLNDVASQNTTNLRHRIPRRRTTNAGGSQAPTQQVPTQGVDVLSQPLPNDLVCGGGMVLPGDFNSPFFQFGETSGARTPGPDPSGFWAMMRAMMLNQPMTGFHMPVTMPQPKFQPDGHREVQQNVVESAELFAQHLKNLMMDSRLNPLAGGPENKELSRSQQRDNGKGPERRPNMKQASRRDKETASKRREPLKEGQGESESHVSVFRRMRVPVTERLYGRRNAFLQNEVGKIRMPCEEQCDRHREVHPERQNSWVEQPVQHPILRAPQGTPIAMDGDMGRPGDERIDLLLQRLDALERRNGAGQVAEPMFRLRSLFSERILRAPLPSSFQMPPIPRYDGTTDPHEHFNRYQTLMNVVTFSEEVLCRSFPATLDGLASEWFSELPEGKIDSWEDLARRFLVHFAGNRKKKLHFSHLLSVRQRPDELLREFLARWKLETTRVYGADDKTRLSTFHLVLRSGDFSKRLALEKPREYSIALAMAEDEAEAEELEANKKKEEAGRLGSIATAVKPTPRKVTIDERPHLPVGHCFWKGRDPHDRRSHGKDIYEEGGEDRRPYPPRGPKLLFPDELTPLTHPVSAILDFAEHQSLVEYDPRFPPICTVAEGPYCRFHRAAGHDTDACKVLKREIENLIQAGYLRQFVKKKNTWRKDDGKKNGDNRGKKPAGTQQKKRKEIGLPSDEEEEDNPRQKRVEENRMIYGGNTGGDSAEQRKKWVHSAYIGDVHSAPGPSKITKTKPLLFGPKDLPEIPSPHRDALVVRCEINEVIIHRSYVDIGSSVNIMYVRTFEEMGLKNELLKRVRTPLSGFTGDIIDSEGLVEVMVTFGDGEHKKTIPVEFLVVRLLGSHNLILGRPALEDLDSVTSVKYLSMKFPTDSGVGVCRGNQRLARLCYQKQTKKMDAHDLRVDSIATALLKEEEGRPRAEPAEDTEDVVIMEEQQEKKIKLGINISAELRTKIIQVLRENFVVLHGVSRICRESKSLITHRLAVGSDAEPVKQRRRHLSKDQRDFVKKEVDMLQAAGHVKEIKYPTWLANVVLAPKGQTFRMCVNYTDLNRACPMDPFPLPNIDQMIDETVGCEVMSFMDAFREGGKFLGYLVSRRGIEPNPEKVKAILDMEPPRSIKEVQRLTGKMAALGQFLSKSSEKSIPFFGTLKKVPQFQWTPECQAAFEELKKYLLAPQVLAKPIKGEKLYLYLGVSPGAISSILLREEGDTQRPIYYVSRTLRDAELRYSVVEKSILAVVNTVKKLNHYFQAHEVEVRSHQPLSIIIRNPTASNRVIKWSVYLSQYQIEMKPRAAIKAQALADFMVECTARDNNPMPTAEQEDWWTLSTDGSSAAKACGGGVVIQSPEGFRSYHAIKFQFKIPRAENTEADVLSKLSNDSTEHISKMAHIEDLGSPSIHVQFISVVTKEASGWIAELIRYKKDGVLPGDETTARLIKRRAPTYVIENGRLYKRSYNGTLLRCVDETKAGQIMEEVHEGICAAHQGPFSMARRIVLQGYFWPTMVKDCAKRAKHCKVCQVFQTIPGRPGTSYHPISSSIPFAHWGMDLIGLMPRAPGNFRWIIVAIDYFTKWIEAEPLVGGTSEQCSKFVSNNILCRYGVPKQITTDNGTQFEAGDFNELLGDWKLRHTYSSVAYPQGNGQVENANRTIMDGIKKRLESYKGAWVDQLPNVLWAYRTTPRRATGETPFSMCYGLEARAPSEVFIPTWREENYEARENEEAMTADLNFVEERREQAFLKAENYRRQVKEYYDRRVRAREYRVGDLVLRKREASQPTEGGKFAKSYEGPYKVTAVLRPGTYKLSTLEGRELGRHWNTHNLISFYM
ncbi:unnamed protein product [Cuscuta campestris]|uniref:Integrase catalytic domain-containing protein n=1 Tax=Cuscuta campestris TaxID=132261 RepID=A0A484L5N0_9ASTE|nr:unnamed protein product [Cuscuta campestris]